MNANPIHDRQAAAAAILAYYADLGIETDVAEAGIDRFAQSARAQAAQGPAGATHQQAQAPGDRAGAGAGRARNGRGGTRAHGERGRHGCRRRGRNAG